MNTSAGIGTVPTTYSKKAPGDDPGVFYFIRGRPTIHMGLAGKGVLAHGSALKGITKLAMPPLCAVITRSGATLYES